MRALIQRVSSASVSAEHNTTQHINKGYVIFLGVGPEDNEKTANSLWSKISKLRIFEDDQGKLIYRFMMLREAFFLSLNLRCTPIAVKEIDHRLLKQQNQNKQKHCIPILGI